MIFIFMAKIIITERQYGLIKEHLSEEIEPEDAYLHPRALKTVIDGKRGVGFYGGATFADVDALEASGLKYFPLGINRAYVFYRDGYEKEATQLASIARKRDGYLPTKTPEETYEIGILLGYNPERVKEFVLKKFPDFKFY